MLEAVFWSMLATGALLVMLCDSMIPEAFEHGGNESGLLLVLGFTVASTVDVAGLQERAENLARENRELDTRIQEANWQIDLLP